MSIESQKREGGGGEGRVKRLLPKSSLSYDERATRQKPTPATKAKQNSPKNESTLPKSSKHSRAKLPPQEEKNSQINWHPFYASFKSHQTSQSHLRLKWAYFVKPPFAPYLSSLSLFSKKEAVAFLNIYMYFLFSVSSYWILILFPPSSSSWNWVYYIFLKRFLNSTSVACMEVKYLRGFGFWTVYTRLGPPARHKWF